MGVLQVDSICVAGVSRRWNMYTVNLNACAAVELEVCLRAVLNCYAIDCHVFTSIKPKRLHTKLAPHARKNTQLISFWMLYLFLLIKLSYNIPSWITGHALQGRLIIFITVGFVLGIFPCTRFLSKVELEFRIKLIEKKQA